MSTNPRDPYGGDIFAGHARTQKPHYPEVPAEPGMVVEVRGDDFVGAVMGVDKTAWGPVVRLEDRQGVERVFNLVKGGFLLEGQPVTPVSYTHLRAHET